MYDDDFDTTPNSALARAAELIDQTEKPFNKSLIERSSLSAALSDACFARTAVEVAATHSTHSVFLSVAEKLCELEDRALYGHQWHDIASHADSFTLTQSLASAYSLQPCLTESWDAISHQRSETMPELYMSPTLCPELYYYTRRNEDITNAVELLVEKREERNEAERENKRLTEHLRRLTTDPAND